MNARLLYKCLIPLLILFVATEAMAQCGYAYRKKITIDKDQVSGAVDLTDFPVLISVTDNDLRTVGNGGRVENANGYDIIFVNEFGEAMPHQVEEYTSTTGEYIAWIRLPIVYASKATEFYMYYGNTAILTDPSTTKVWDNNYQAVWHLHDDLNDKTDVGNDMTNSGSTDASAKIGDGQSFNGSTDYLFRTDANLNGNIPSLSSGSPDEFTLSGWIYLDATGARRPLLSKQGTGSGTDRGFVFMMESDNRLKAELFKNNVSGDRTEVYSTATLTTNTWYYISMTYKFITDGTSEAYLYINGANDGSTNSSVGPIVANARDLHLGRYFWQSSTEYYHDGLIDEVRISDVVRSPDWIATEYNNQNNPSSFYSIGSEEGGAYTPVIPACGYGYRKVITIDADSVYGSTAHANFPLLVSVTDNDLRTVANGGHVESDNGFDIVFTDTNLIPLDFQVEKYVASTGEYICWVKIPSLPTGTDLDIHMFYGSADAFANPSTSCTWSEFEGVWHLHDDFLDSSPNSENGTNNGSADDSPSKIGDGQSFDGTDFIELSSFPNLTSDFTITGWINTSDNAEAGQRIFCDDESNSGGYALSLGDGGTGQLRFYSRSMNGVILDGPTNNIVNSTWYYVSGVVDRGNEDRFIYVNGIQVAADLTDSGTWGSDGGNASIGGETASGETANRFEGFLDEIRVSNVARSADWLKTEYSNQNWPSDFISFGSEVSLNATSTASGDWDLTGTWAGGVVPGLGANVTILHDVDLDDRDETICNLTLSTSNNNATSFEMQSSRTLTVMDKLILEGSGSGNIDLTLQIDDGNSKLIAERNMTVILTDGDDILIESDNSGDSLIVRGDMNIQMTGGDEIDIGPDNPGAIIQVEGNVSAGLDAGTDDLIEFNLDAGEFNVGGNVTLSRTNAGDLEFDLDGGDFSCDSLYIVTSGGGGSDQVNFYIDESSEFVVNKGMNMIMGGGDDHQIYVNNNAGSDAEFTVNGDLNWMKSGGDDLVVIVDDANSLFHVTGDFNIISTGAEEIDINLDGGDLNVDGNFMVVDSNNSGDNVHFDLDGGDITVGDTLKLFLRADATVIYHFDMDNASVVNTNTLMAEISGQSGGEELFLDVDGSCQLTVTNDMLVEANTGNDLEIHLGQNTTNSTAQLTVGGDLTLDHNGSSGVDDIQFIINDDCVVSVNGDFTMDTDGSGSAGNFYTRINDNGLLDVNSDIIMDNTIGSGYLEIEMNDSTYIKIGGNFVRNASPNNYGLVQSNDPRTTIEYNGTGSQIFADEDGAGSDGIEYEVVIINNTSASEPQLTMEAPVTLTNSITFTDGVLQTTSSDVLTIADNATSNIGNAGSYVSGPVSKVGDDNFIFPLGNSGIWAPLAISNLQNGPAATDVFTAEYFRSTHPESFWDSLSYSGDPGGMYNTSVVEYWDLSRDNGNTEPYLSLYWSDNDSSFIDDTSELVIAHYLGSSTWFNEGGAAFGMLSAGNVRSLNAISTFSVFTFGSTSESANPLPVELLTFSATEKEDVVELNWKTASEINNEKFIIERSLDARIFENIGHVNGAGNSHVLLDYQFVDDDPYPGTSYYRLKQVDFNGEYTYSNVEAVFFGKEDACVVYPNPVESELRIRHNLSGEVKVEIYDELGHLIKRLKLTSDQINVQNLSSGMHLIILRDESGIILKQRFVKH